MRFTYDSLGAVRAIFNTAGAQTSLTNYASYGKTLDSTGTRGTIFGYTGEPTDEAGLVYLRERTYDPVIG